MPAPAFLRHWRALRAAAVALAWTPPEGVRHNVAICPRTGHVSVAMLCGCAAGSFDLEPRSGRAAIRARLAHAAHGLVAEHARVHAEADRRAAREAAAVHAEWITPAARRDANFRNH